MHKIKLSKLKSIILSVYLDKDNDTGLSKAESD